MNVRFFEEPNIYNLPKECRLNFEFRDAVRRRHDIQEKWQQIVNQMMKTIHKRYFKENQPKIHKKKVKFAKEKLRNRFKDYLKHY
jgi:hypothetical protein